MITIEVLEAETRFASLLEQVARGEEVLITKHGKPLARLVPAADLDQERLKAVIAEIKELRKHNTLGGLSVRELRDEGRR